ncbi:MAG: MBL fold metallo-hydrolase [Deltaproteobacteria bacterium]|nr:MBL fold metallo-hydrolase [Deltaproteobacteria bacterium]
MGPRTAHFDGRRFLNQVPAREKRALDVLRWWWTRKPPEWPEKLPTPAPGPRPPARVREPGRVRVTFINHATVLLQLDGVNVLTDPVYSDRVGPWSGVGPKRHRPPGIAFADLPPIDLVLISHNHYDHLDLPTLRRLAERHRPRILVPLGNRALLERHGIPGGEEYDWGQSARHGHLRVTLSPSRHWSGRGLADRSRTLWAAYVVQGSAGAVYFAGDTGWGPHFAEARRRFGPFRLALLPIGSYEPRWFMADSHLSPEEALRAHLALGAATSVAIHFGTFRLSDENWDDPPRALAAVLSQYRVPRSRFWVLEGGEARELLAR